MHTHTWFRRESVTYAEEGHKEVTAERDRAKETEQKEQRVQNVPHNTSTSCNNSPSKSRAASKAIESDDLKSAALALNTLYANGDGGEIHRPAKRLKKQIEDGGAKKPSQDAGARKEEASGRSQGEAAGSRQIQPSGEIRQKERVREIANEGGVGVQAKSNKKFEKEGKERRLNEDLLLKEQLLKAQLLSSQAKTLATKPTPKQTATHTDNISRKQPGKIDTGKHATKHGMRDKERDKDRQMSMCDTKGGRSEGGGALEKDAEMSR